MLAGTEIWRFYIFNVLAKRSEDFQQIHNQSPRVPHRPPTRIHGDQLIRLCSVGAVEWKQAVRRGDRSSAESLHGAGCLGVGA